MENYQSDFRKKTKRFKGLWVAVFLILFGVLFLFLNMGIIPAAYKPVLISWPMLLMVIGVYNLFKRWYAGGVFLLLAGAFFLYQKLSIAFPEYFSTLHIDFKTYWPVLFILAGIIGVIHLVFHPRVKYSGHSHRHKNRQADVLYENCSVENNTTDYIEKKLSFGSLRQIVLSSDFKGGKIDLTFGELILDLRKSTLAGGPNLLEINVVFGSVTVYVPEDWVVELHAETFLGNFQDNRYNVNPVEGTSSDRLIIKGSSVFGNGEIQY